MKFFRFLFLAGLTGLLALLPSATCPAAPKNAPIIVHEPISSFSMGEPVTIRALIHSPQGKQIFSPAVFVRAAGVKEFSRIALQPVAGEAHAYTALIPASLTRGNFEYFVESFDDEGNGPARVSGPGVPIQVKATTAAVAEPAPPPPTPSPSPETKAGHSFVIEAPVPAPPPRSWKRTTGIVGLSAGGAIVVGGLVSGALALSAKHDMEHAVDETHYATAKKSAFRSARAANVLVATGVIVAGASAVLLYSWKKDEGHHTQVLVDAGPSGAMLQLTGRF